MTEAARYFLRQSVMSTTCAPSNARGRPEISPRVTGDMGAGAAQAFRRRIYYTY